MREKRKKSRYVKYGAQAKKKPRVSMRLMAKWSVFALIAIATAVAYVWQRNTIISLGYEINELRRETSAAGNEELKLQATLLRLQRPQDLWAEVNSRALGLEEIAPSQVMTLMTPRPFCLPTAKRRASDYPPAASRTVAKSAVATPHRESSVLRQRR